MFPIRCKNDIIVFNRVLYLIKIKKGEIQMAITLSKGQKVSLTKGNPGLKHIVVGLGWDTNKYDGGFDFDLDSAAFFIR
ncbi:general stress protein 16U family protein [Intestinibacter bartlettii DSM 16795]|nr:general stress protein 16U family protein [Intestinibacter bartlettii DSM 16795]